MNPKQQFSSERITQRLTCLSSVCEWVRDPELSGAPMIRVFTQTGILMGTISPSNRRRYCFLGPRPHGHEGYIGVRVSLSSAVAAIEDFYLMALTECRDIRKAEHDTLPSNTGDLQL